MTTNLTRVGRQDNVCLSFHLFGTDNLCTILSSVDDFGFGRKNKFTPIRPFDFTPTDTFVSKFSNTLLCISLVKHFPYTIEVGGGGETRMVHRYVWSSRWKFKRKFVWIDDTMTKREPPYQIKTHESRYSSKMTDVRGLWMERGVSVLRKLVVGKIRNWGLNKPPRSSEDLTSYLSHNHNVNS